MTVVRLRRLNLKIFILGVVLYSIRGETTVLIFFPLISCVLVADPDEDYRASSSINNSEYHSKLTKGNLPILEKGDVLRWWNNLSINVKDVYSAKMGS